MTDSRQLTSMRGSPAIWRAACARSSSSCRAPLSLSGFPGVTSHHTRSSFSRLIANRLIARWAICGGLNEPPSKPMRMPLVWRGIVLATDGEETDASFNGSTANRSLFVLTRFLHANRCPPRIASGAGFRLKTLCHSRPRLPGTVDAILETSQLFGADRAAGVKFPGGDADFRAEAEFAAVGKLRRRVMQHDCRIDLVEEFARGGFVLGHDRVRVLRTVVVNMRDRFIDAVH